MSTINFESGYLTIHKCWHAKLGWCVSWRFDEALL